MYAYVGNAPLLQVDPSGHQNILIGLQASAVKGLIGGDFSGGAYLNLLTGEYGSFKYTGNGNAEVHSKFLSEAMGRSGPGLRFLFHSTPSNLLVGMQPFSNVFLFKVQIIL